MRRNFTLAVAAAAILAVRLVNGDSSPFCFSSTEVLQLDGIKAAADDVCEHWIFLRQQGPMKVSSAAMLSGSLGGENGLASDFLPHRMQLLNWFSLMKNKTFCGPLMCSMDPSLKNTRQSTPPLHISLPASTCSQTHDQHPHHP